MKRGSLIFRRIGQHLARQDWTARLASQPFLRSFLAMRYGIEVQKLDFTTRLDGETQRLIALLPSE